ncbi:hypothetical protein [Marinobacter orientalis]|nr:hypothetical protein [Marinobacter orientalis]
MRRKDGGVTRIQDFEEKDLHMNNIVYIVGAVVIVLAVLSFFGFR